MMNRMIILLLFFTISCSSTVSCNGGGELTKEQQKIIYPFYTINSEIWAEVYDSDKYQYRTFTKEQYFEILNSYKTKQANTLKELLKDYEEIQVYPYQKTFVICAYSSKVHFAMCDDSYCENLERKNKAHSKDVIQELRKGLPEKKCSK